MRGPAQRRHRVGLRGLRPPVLDKQTTRLHWDAITGPTRTFHEMYDKDNPHQRGMALGYLTRKKWYKYDTTPMGEALLGFSGEVDRIYHDTPAALTLLEVGPARHLRLLKMGWPDAVTWNIGGAKAGSLKDLAPGEWEKYVCLEAAIVAKPRTLQPQASFAAGQTFTAGVDAPKEVQKKLGTVDVM